MAEGNQSTGGARGNDWSIWRTLVGLLGGLLIVAALVLLIAANGRSGYAAAALAALLGLALCIGALVAKV